MTANSGGSKSRSAYAPASESFGSREPRLERLRPRRQKRDNLAGFRAAVEEEKRLLAKITKMHAPAQRNSVEGYRDRMTKLLFCVYLLDLVDQMKAQAEASAAKGIKSEVNLAILSLRKNLLNDEYFDKLYKRLMADYAICRPQIRTCCEGLRMGFEEPKTAVLAYRAGLVAEIGELAKSII